MTPRRDPFDRIRRMIENMSSGGFGGGNPSNRFVEQSLDSDEGVLSIVMDIPGASKEDINATVAERGNRQFLVVEAKTSTGNMQRQYREQISLDARVDSELADSEYNNGVLTIEFPVVDDDRGDVTIDIQ